MTKRSLFHLTKIPLLLLLLHLNPAHGQSGLVITGGWKTKRDVEVFPVNWKTVDCEIPSFPDPGKYTVIEALE